MINTRPSLVEISRSTSWKLGSRFGSRIQVANDTTGDRLEILVSGVADDRAPARGRDHVG
jgi:hypothetical protein